jgi:hypothetical protein
MVGPAHMACGQVRAMRSWSRALRYRRRQEGAAGHHPGGRGRSDRHARRHPDDPGHGHAVCYPASGRPHRQPRRGRGGGRPGVRPGGLGDFRIQARKVLRRGRRAAAQKAGAGPDDRVLAGWPARRAERLPRVRAPWHRDRPGDGPVPPAGADSGPNRNQARPARIPARPARIPARPARSPARPAGSAARPSRSPARLAPRATR